MPIIRQNLEDRKPAIDASANGSVCFSDTASEELNTYREAGFDLIPLHTAKSGKGKQPQDKQWTERLYKVEDQVRHMEKGGNVGVRLRPEHLVIDVDPRSDDGRYGHSSFTEFVLWFGLDPTEWPVVETGGGGQHYYLAKPEDVPVIGGLKEFPGIEFKTFGQQVVAAGSVHSDTGKRYGWDFPNDDLRNRPECPEALLDAIRRKNGEATFAEPGIHTPDELEVMLSYLDAEDFQNQERWLHLMMSCHHATAGAGRDEFVSWSTSDPVYDGHDEIIKKRWDSLASVRDDGVTYKTLYKFLRDAGAESAIPATVAGSDFPDDLTVGESPIGPLDLLVEEMNEQFCAVLDGGGFSVFMQDQDTVFEHRPYWSRLSREAFRHFFEDERIKIPGDNRGQSKSKADIWLTHPKRRKYRGLIMDPDCRPENKDKLNLWQGWSFDPEPGDWSLMRELIEDVLCDGNDEASEYVLNWIAHMLQHPSQPAETAIAFRGKEGTGKGTLGRALMRIAGTHGMTVSPAQLAGRFNSHLRDCIFLFADEAIWPGDKSAEGTLKQLITEPVISYEAKGKDLVQGRNMLHLMLASNEPWVVPAGIDARRFFVTDVSDKRKDDRDFFSALWRQMDNGGLAGMVFDLLDRDLTDWHPAKNLPKTQALADQKLESLGPFDEFWLDLLSEGELPVLLDIEIDNIGDWKEQPITLGSDDRKALISACESFLIRKRYPRQKVTHKAILEVGRKLGVEDSRTPGGKERLWVLPPLPEMRDRFEQMIGAEGLFD